MLTVSVQSNIREQMAKLESARSELKDKAIMRALNRAIDSTKSAASSKLRQTYAIKKKDLDPAFSVSKAWPGKLSASIRASGSPLPLYDFGASWNRRWTGARFTIKRSARKSLASTFIATMKSGHTGVWKRTGRRSSSGKWQIEEKFTASVPTLFASKDVEDSIRSVAVNVFDRNLKQQLTYLFGA